MPTEVPKLLVDRYDRAGPRYTSYPTANVFEESFGADAYAAALRRLGASGRPVSLYTHLPFCRSLCHYCACNVVITSRPDAPGRYLDALELELDLVCAELGGRVPVAEIHLGGGTPTLFRVTELERLYDILAARFDLSGAEALAVEIDPRVTSKAQLATLANLGWNRASFGVQDFDPEVQWAINRVQPLEQTESLITAARELGYQGINVDLIYGLPQQSLEGFSATLQNVIRIRPERVALYSYAHVPWMRPAQRRFEKPGYRLPTADEKVALFLSAVAAFEAAGYVHLGMDHFALPSDELAVAQARGELHRNFQGYAVQRADDLLALGMSAISDLGGVFAQNAKDLPEYEEAVRSGKLATVRGWELSKEDQRRRRAIMALMSGRGLTAEEARAFVSEVGQLEPLERDGLVRLIDGAVEVTPLGKFFLRNVAMPFDAYLQSRSEQPLFSRTV